MRVCVCSIFFFFSSRRRHTRCSRDWSSDVCSSDLLFDCYVSDGHTKSIDTDTGRIRRKARVLVGAARRRWVENVQDAARETGLNVEQITLSQVGAVNAFKMLPEDSHADVVALLDIGV